jgi:hypothetical protein
MATIKTALTIAALTLGISTAANATSYEAADDSLESQLCVAAATASKMSMHKEVSQFRPSVMTSTNYRLVANKVYCNGEKISDFAYNAGNMDVAAKLKSYSNRTVEIHDIADVRHGNVLVGSK